MVQIIRRNRMSLLYGELQCPIVEIVLNPYRNQKFQIRIFFPFLLICFICCLLCPHLLFQDQWCSPSLDLQSSKLCHFDLLHCLDLLVHILSIFLIWFYYHCSLLRRSVRDDKKHRDVVVVDKTNTKMLQFYNQESELKRGAFD